MGRITHIEFNADSPEGLRDFYVDVFGWTIEKKWIGEEDYWLIHTGRSSEPGIHGGLRKRFQKDAGVIPTVRVDSLDEALARVEGAGGKKVTERTSIPGTGYIAYCQDPENNIVCILEADSDAK